jgi:ATP-dependent Clp protease adapter protein ClpS
MLIAFGGARAMPCEYCPFCGGKLPPWSDVSQQSPNASDRPTAVIFENDDATPQRLVADILREVFGYPGHLAVERVNEVHEKGSAVVCVVDEEEARLLAATATAIARAADKPLVVIVKPFRDIDVTRS